MTFQQIVKITKTKGINPQKKKKVDLIREIQNAENNITCYATARVEHCGELGCLWRVDCVAVNNHGPGNK